MIKKCINYEVLVKIMKEYGYNIVKTTRKDVKTKEQESILIFTNLVELQSIESLDDKNVGAYVGNERCYLSFNKSENHYYGIGFNTNEENKYISPNIHLINKQFIDFDQLSNWIVAKELNLDKYIVTIKYIDEKEFDSVYTDLENIIKDIKEKFKSTAKYLDQREQVDAYNTIQNIKNSLEDVKHELEIKSQAKKEDNVNQSKHKEQNRIVNEDEKEDERKDKKEDKKEDKAISSILPIIGEMIFGVNREEMEKILNNL